MSDLEQLRHDLIDLDTRLRNRLSLAVVEVIFVAKDATKRHTFQNQSGNTEGSIPDPVVRETMKGAEASLRITNANALRMQFGTKAHDIFPRGGIQAAAAVKSHKMGQTQRASGGVLRWEAGGVPVFARYVRHPGTPAFDWLGEAADAADAAIDGIVNAAIDDVLNR